MNCPDCNQQMWPYNENTLTCKNGHRYQAVHAPEPMPSVALRREVPEPPPASHFWSVVYFTLGILTGAGASVVLNYL